MSFIATIAPDAADGATAEMYRRQQASWGFVPNYAKVFGHRPEIMARWGRLLAEIKRPIDPRRFELVTFVAAHTLGNSACTLVHGKALRLFFSDAQILAIAADRLDGVLGAAEQAMLHFARQVAIDASMVTAADVAALAAQGFTDAEIFDIAAAVAGRAFFTKVLDALGVQADAPMGPLDATLRSALTVGRPIDERPPATMPAHRRCGPPAKEAAVPPDAAEIGRMQPLLAKIAAGLDDFLKFEHPDALHPGHTWRKRLDRPLPRAGIGIDAVADELVRHVIPNGSSVPRPGFSSFITTGAVTASALASTAAGIAAPQRYGHTAFNFLEELSLRWLVEMFGLRGMEGVYSSGGSVANLLALGAARQRAFERLGRDPAADGIDRPVAVYATTEAHHTIQRSAGVLGIGRSAVRAIPCDRRGRMRVDALRAALAEDRRAGVLPMAIVANAGTTNTGAIDPLREIGEIARDDRVWFHVDGAYGLPGVLDERVAPLYAGLELADSVIVDPHKWLGAAVGVAATFVRDRELLRRAFTQEPAVYLEGSMEAASVTAPAIEHSMDDFGVPYYDFGVELSAPSRGVVVWALIREIGVAGMTERIRRHNDMARRIAQVAGAHPKLELLLEPTLSICCFRYVSAAVDDLDGLNQRLHRRLTRENRNMPSTTRVNGQLALRPCFIGARSTFEHAEALVADVLRIGAELEREVARCTAEDLA